MAADIRDAMVNQMLSEKVRATIPDAATIEDIVAASLTEIKDGETATLEFKGVGIWRLHQMKEGPRKGQWLIFRPD
ncbi:MAG: hypothetical protein JO332_12120 [Planctomycetaceae bacterium]|nr:hypothetical protein [Planctomycetaceae bacterium]